MPSTNIQASFDADYLISNPSFSEARNSPKSDSVFLERPDLRPSVLDSFDFTRTYATFDCSSIRGLTITGMWLNVYCDYHIPGSLIYIFYCGSSTLTGDNFEYPLYLTQGSNRWNAPVEPTDAAYNQIYLDSRLFPYPTLDRNSNINIGLIAANDYLNDGKANNQIIYQSSTGINPPYLEIQYSGGGYANPVMGVSNFTDLSGVPSANILSVMGV
jgi:hypothetical protein